MAQCLQPQHPPTSPLSPAGLAQLTLLGLAQVSSLKGWRTTCSQLLKRVPPAHPSPTQEAWPLQTPQAVRLPSGFLHTSTCIPAPTPGLPGPGPMGSGYSTPHFSEYGAAPSSWPSCTRAHSFPVHTQLPSTPLCSQKAWDACTCTPNPAQTLELLSPGQLGGVHSPQPPTGHVRGHQATLTYLAKKDFCS